MSEAVYVVSVGAVTPLGHDAWASAAAVRAGIAGFAQHPYMVDEVGEPMRVASVPGLDAAFIGTRRFEALLEPAIDEALAVISAAPAGRNLRCALALALPCARPGLPEDLARALTTHVRQRHGALLHAVAVMPHGHAAAGVALNAAWPELSEGSLDACLLAGVDSYLDPLTLEWLEASEQLHGGGRFNNAWGMIPGEAAGAVLLARESVVCERGWQPLARVLGAGVAHEPKHIKTDTVCIGEGLTSAFHQALSGVPEGMQVTDIYCDMNGEPYRADEYGFTALRPKAHFASPSEFHAPADCWGDVGAASGLLHMMLACVAAGKRYGKGPLAFVWGSSESGERAAALLGTMGGA